MLNERLKILFQKYIDNIDNVAERSEFFELFLNESNADDLLKVIEEQLNIDGQTSKMNENTANEILKRILNK